MPIGSRSSFSGVPALSIASAYSADMIEAKSMAMLAMNGACGAARVNFTVRSSTFSTDFSRLFMSMLAKYSYVPPETLL